MNGDFSDAVFVVGGHEFHLHKAILSKQSPVFQAMFSVDLKESQQNRVEIPDVSAEVFEVLLSYIYAGKIPPMDQFVVELFVAADKVFHLFSHRVSQKCR